jgi:hypothetical protein
LSGYHADVVTVGDTGDYISVVSDGGLLVQNIGDGPVTLGPPGVRWECGIVLPAHMTAPIWVPGRQPPGVSVMGESSDSLVLLGRTLSGTSKIAYLVPG